MVIVLVYVRLYCVTTVTSSYEGSYKYYCVTTVTFSSEESYCGTRGVLNKVLYGEGPPRGPTPYLLYTILDRKGTLFVYLLLTNGIPFTYLV